VAYLRSFADMPEGGVRPADLPEGAGASS